MANANCSNSLSPFHLPVETTTASDKTFLDIRLQRNCRACTAAPDCNACITRAAICVFSMIFSCLKSQKPLTIFKKRLTHVICTITSVIFGVMSLPHLAYIAGVPQDGAPPQSLELESNMAIDYQEGSMDNFITGLHLAHVCPILWKLAWECWEASCTEASAVSWDIRPGVM